MSGTVYVMDDDLAVRPRSFLLASGGFNVRLLDPAHRFSTPLTCEPAAWSRMCACRGSTGWNSCAS